MTLSKEQLEWIVQEVVRRLRKEPASTNSAAGRLEMVDRLVTLESLRNRLSGVKRVEVGHQTIVTPAVIDLLNERKIELIRQ